MITDAAAWLRDRRVLLLSPHADDVAYSIGGLVALSGPGAAMTMLTVFGRSAWALSRELRAEGVEAIARARAAEDGAYCAVHGISYVALDFDDSSERGYDEAGELAAAPADDPQTGAVRDALLEQVRTLSPDLILAPASIGGHIDHRIVTQAVRSLGRDRVAFYEDVPYAAWRSLRDIERALTGAGMTPAVAADISRVLDEKIDGMWRYTTQTTAGTIGEMLLHAERLGMGGARYVERLWI